MKAVDAFDTSVDGWLRKAGWGRFKRKGQLGWGGDSGLKIWRQQIQMTLLQTYCKGNREMVEK